MSDSNKPIDVESADICKLIGVVALAIAIICSPQFTSFRPGFVIAAWLILLNSISAFYLELQYVENWWKEIGIFSARGISYFLAMASSLFHPAISILRYFPNTQSLDDLAQTLYIFAFCSFLTVLIALKRGTHPRVAHGTYLPFLICFINFLLSFF